MLITLNKPLPVVYKDKATCLTKKFTIDKNCNSYLFFSVTLLTCFIPNIFKGRTGSLNGALDTFYMLKMSF